MFYRSLFVQQRKKSLFSCSHIGRIRRQSLGALSIAIPLVLLFANGHESFVCLQVLPLRLVVENVRHLTSVDSGTARTLVNADHGHTHRPGAVSDAERQVLVICFHILLHHAVLHDYVEGVEDLRVQPDFEELFKEWKDTFLAHRVLACLQFPLRCVEPAFGLTTHRPKLCLPRFQHFFAPNEHHVALLLDWMLLTLVLEFAHVEVLLVVLLASLNHVG